MIEPKFQRKVGVVLVNKLSEYTKYIWQRVKNILGVILKCEVCSRCKQLLSKMLRRLLANPNENGRLEKLYIDTSAKIAKLSDKIVSKEVQLYKLITKNTSKSVQIEKLRDKVVSKSVQVDMLRTKIAAKSVQIEKLRCKVAHYSAHYNIARPYFSIYRQGLLFDEISKSDVDLSADCYLSLLPSTVPAAVGLRRHYGGMVICDCVENVEVDKHSLAPKIHRTTLDLVNFAAYGALLSVDKLMTVGDALGRTLSRFNRPLLILPNYRRFEEPEAANELRKLCGLGSEEVLLFASGNVVIGFEPVLEALATLPAQVHLAALVHLKPDIYEAAMKNRVVELGLTNRVHFFPFVPYDRLASVAADADIGLVTSDIANPNGAVALPNRVFDYLTAGLPIIAPPMPDVVELLRIHGCGLSLQEVTAEAWRTALETVIANLSGYRAAANMARRLETWESVEDQLFEFLGRPRTITLLGFRDLSRYQRFLRIAYSLSARGTKVKAVFLSSDPAPVNVPGAEFYHFTDRYGLGSGLARVGQGDKGVTNNV